MAPDRESLEMFFKEADTRKCGSDCSGLVLLDRGEEALRWRLALIDLARRSLDLQYYIWQSDESGRLIFSRILAAADRGVRVRLLLDDTALLGKESNAILANNHPNIEIRSFNPFSARSSIWTLVDGMFNLKRLNRRMHNKLLVADNSIAISGGRNIGNKYFGLDRRMNFRDMDLLGVGSVAEQLSETFDAYWNSPWSFRPDSLVEPLSEPPSEETLQRIRKRFNTKLAKDLELMADYLTEPGRLAEMQKEARKKLVIAPAKVVHDSPDIESSAGVETVFRAINQLSDQSSRDSLIVSPYFIPTGEGVKTLAEKVSRGRTVTILTNSLASNDVTATNASYKHYRRPLVEAGIRLFELRADAQARQYHSAPPLASSTYLGLHAKVMVFDHRNVFIGSMNLDPRSVLLNTELGVLVDSKDFAARVEEAFSRDLDPANSYRIIIDSDGRIGYRSSAGTVYRQPARSWWQRFLDWLIPGRLLESHL